VNESNWNRWAPAVQRVVAAFKNGEGKVQPKNARYIGSLVADVHRNLISGGVFLYPAATNYPQGKLRLLYEAAPLAFVVEQAGGRATDGCRSILDIVPEDLHQKTPLVIGSPGCRWRSISRPRWGTARTIRWPRARWGGRAWRSIRWTTWSACSTGSRSTRFPRP